MKKAFLFAMTFAGTFIGAGFATGQEIMSFFVLKSSGGIVFYIISCFLMTFICKRTADLCEKGALFFYKDLFGEFMGKFVFLISMLSLFSCFAATVAATGSLLSGENIMSFYEGAILMALLSVFICNHGIEGLYAVNGILTPFIIVFSVIFGLLSALNPEVQSVMSVSRAGKRILIPLWYGVLYAGYNVFSLIPVSIAAGKVKRAGYIIAFSVTAVAGAAVFLAISANLHTAILYELPFFETVRHISRISGKIYFFVLLFSLVTTASSCLYGFVNGIEALFKIKRKSIYIICAGGLFLSIPMGLSGIVRIVYPLFGAAGAAVILRILLKNKKK